MIKNFLIFLIMLVHLNALAQIEQQDKWKLTVGFGPAFPLPKYGDVNLERSISYRDQDMIPVFEFYDKENAGGAEIGYFIAGSLSRYLSSNIFISFNFDFTQNSVGTNELEAYYDEVMNTYYSGIILDEEFNHVFNQAPYKVRFIYFGIGYSLFHSQFCFSLQALIGQGTMDYPEYDLQVNHANGTMLFKHRGSITNPKSLTYGLAFDVSYLINKSLFLKVLTKYLAADFHYEIEPHIVGSSNTRNRSDVVNFRSIDLGIGIGVTF